MIQLNIFQSALAEGLFAMHESTFFGVSTLISWLLVKASDKKTGEPKGLNAHILWPANAI